MTEQDYSGFAGAVPSAQGLADLSKTAIELQEAERDVAQKEMDLKSAQQRVQDLSERVLPGLMEQVGLEEIKLSNGAKLTVEQILTVSPLKANRDRVLMWLDKTGHGGKIKRAVTVNVGKDEAKAAELVAMLHKEYDDVEMEKWVEPMTLKAHVKAVLAEGAEVDMDMLGARQFARAKITGPKAEKSAAGPFAG